MMLFLHYIVNIYLHYGLYLNVIPRYTPVQQQRSRHTAFSVQLFHFKGMPSVLSDALLDGLFMNGLLDAE